MTGNTGNLLLLLLPDDTRPDLRAHVCFHSRFLFFSFFSFMASVDFKRFFRKQLPDSSAPFGFFPSFLFGVASHSKTETVFLNVADPDLFFFVSFCFSVKRIRQRKPALPLFPSRFLPPSPSPFQGRRRRRRPSSRPPASDSAQPPRQI